MCLWVGTCLWEQVPIEARRGHWIPWAVVTGHHLMWVLGTKLGSSLRAVSFVTTGPPLHPSTALLRNCWGPVVMGSDIHPHCTTQQESKPVPRSRKHVGLVLQGSASQTWLCRTHCWSLRSSLAMQAGPLHSAVSLAYLSILKLRENSQIVKLRLSGYHLMSLTNECSQITTP